MVVAKNAALAAKYEEIATREKERVETEEIQEAKNYKDFIQHAAMLEK